MRKFVKILGVKIDSLMFDEAIEKIDTLIKSKKTAQITTVNPEFIMTAQKDQRFRQIINTSDLALPDGFGLILASKFLNQPFKERITGVDLTWAICKLAEDRGYSIFFLGGKENIAKKTAQRIKNIHPRLKIAGFYAGASNDIKTYKLLNQTKPDILLVAFGAPKQEKFIYNLIHKVSNFDIRISDLPRLSIGVGGTFDYIAGIHPYAPAWMRKAGLEWLFRLFTQPWRFRRIWTAVIRFPLAIIKFRFQNFFQKNIII